MDVQSTTERLHRAFAPDHFNYAFRQNQDHHVHLHVIPRYATPRHVAGLRFDDPDYPGHYAVPGPEQRVSPAVLDALARRLTDGAYRGRGAAQMRRVGGYRASTQVQFASHRPRPSVF